MHPNSLANLKRGGGRKKGDTNFTTEKLKRAILDAFDEAGGKAYLLRQAEENPREFLAFVSKIIPRQVDNTHSSPDGGPIQVSVGQLKRMAQEVIEAGGGETGGGEPGS